MRRLFFILLLFSFFSCAHRLPQTHTSTITLIVRGYSSDMRIQLTEKGTIAFPYDFVFLDGYNLNIYVISSEYDTVTIPAYTDWVEVNFMTIPKGSFSFLFKRGDTVVVDYGRGYPHAHVLNRSANDDVLNYNRYIRSIVTVDGISSNNKIVLSRSKIKNYSSLKSLQDSCNSLYLKEVYKELSILDSMLRVAMLDEMQYHYRRLNIIRTLHALNSVPGVDDALVQQMLSEYPIADNFSDSLFNYSAYRYFLTRDYYDRLHKIPAIEHSHGYSPNYSARFDSIVVWPMFSERMRCYMLTVEMRDICKHESVSNIERYAQRYLSITGDTALLNSMLAEQSIGLHQTTDLNLLAPSGERLTFDGLLEQHRGSLVYVDYWAAWCAPCVRSLPDAARLRAEYAGRDVVFVYLSLDTRDDAWREAMQKHQLAGSDCRNYLITNPKTARMLEALNIPPIPRYMLYGRNGELLHANAPGSHGEAIRQLLDAELRLE